MLPVKTILRRSVSHGRLGEASLPSNLDAFNLGDSPASWSRHGRHGRAHKGRDTSPRCPWTVRRASPTTHIQITEVGPVHYHGNTPLHILAQRKTANSRQSRIFALCAGTVEEGNSLRGRRMRHPRQNSIRAARVAGWRMCSPKLSQNRTPNPCQSKARFFRFSARFVIISDKNLSGFAKGTRLL